ncbi:DUF47 domain-containing protein [Candidatus Magnetaquicoccus inordinatus]|uniref:DUF47 domain-containing protein n=1 Tax=Candidatus Magnetaquicoccus inordinatus TaxID=2496818 RepID=UPI00187D4138|nr:DUF47 family protein [Candidatus Magnetaquicoccus inordinatus]
MSGSSPMAAKLLANVYPRVPDFYTLINEQCALVSEAMEALVEYMGGDQSKGALIGDLEKKGTEVKNRSMYVLNKSFATPMDREDIYRAITAIDTVLHYANTTIQEIGFFKLSPDQHMLDMARILSEGTDALKLGFAKLGTNPAMAEDDALAVRKSERNVEKAYRKALSNLFQPEIHLEKIKLSKEATVEGRVMGAVTEIFKRRELYRHLSNAGDQIAKAGSVLHDIVVQVS